jgi:hypothetical protein
MCRYNNIWRFVESYIGQDIEPTFGDKLTWVNKFFSVIFKKKLILLFIILTSGFRAKRTSVSLFNIIFVLKEKGEITLLLTVY